ncbi:MAG: DUF2254 domain-containing protein [Chitinophagaceae bacterium]
MKKNVEFYYKRLLGRLWFRPLLFCLLSIAVALLAQLADNSFIADIAPAIEKSSVEELLSILSATMLVIAIFAVGSMLSAFSAASSSATPRSFKLVVADDVSQNALSVYIGSFIFSIVALVALKNGYYGQAGYFTLFILTLLVFAVVIITFLRWVERISKLGRLGHTIQKIEEATKKVLINRLEQPYLGCHPIKESIESGTPVYTKEMGYVLHINMDKLQELASDSNALITVVCIPGRFVSPEKPLVYITYQDANGNTIDNEELEKAFSIDDNRSFYDDPRFGLIVLSEIASRALSPGINDPGTAIAIIASHIRLFSLWVIGIKKEKTETVKYNRISVPAISLADMFDDAFRPIERDGAGNIEVMIRLQKALITIAHIGNTEVKELAILHSRQAFERAEIAMDYKNDLVVLKKESLFSKS